MIKKLLFKSILLFAIFMGGGAYVAYIKGVDVTTMASRLFNFSNPFKDEMNVQTLAPLTRPGDDGAARAGTTRVYKWQDKHGQWHYTQIRPPADAAAVSSMDVDPKTNVIAGYRAPQPQITAEPEPPPPEPAQQAEPEIPDNPYSPETIKKLFEDAKDLQQKLTERYETQQQLLTNQ